MVIGVRYLLDGNFKTSIYGIGLAWIEEMYNFKPIPSNSINIFKITTSIDPSMLIERPKIATISTVNP